MNGFMLARLGLLGGTMLVGPVAAAQDPHAFLGRWDLDVHGVSSSYPSWIEVSEISGKLRVNLVGPVGDAAEAVHVRISGPDLEFVSLKDANEGKDTDVQYRAHRSGSQLIGSLLATDGRSASWTGVPAPNLNTSGEPRWGKPIALFNGHSFDGWHFSKSPHANWVVQDGTFSNTGRGAELISDGKFKDFKLHLEFKSGQPSNSGIYLRGRYEVQIETNSAAEKPSHHTGGVYGFLEPHPEQPRKADIWQSFDIVLVGRLLTVVQNGITVIDHKEIPGITGGALDSKEGESGPLYLQGSEEGTTTFRNVILTPAVE